MQRRYIALPLLLVTAYFGGQFAYKRIQTAKRPESVDPAPATPAQQRALPNPGTDLPPVAEIPDEPTQFDPPDDLALADELLASFASDSAYRRFIDAAERAGFRIIGRNDRLRSARIQVDGSSSADRLRALAGDDASFDYNYIVAAPTAPQPVASGAGSSPFENQSLNWLGVPADHANWGEGVTIAILDTAVSSHPVLENAQIERATLIDDSSGGMAEYSGHGTAVASLIAGNNGVGIAPAADILSIQVMDSSGLGDSFTLAEGIVQAVDSGAQVISMSLGSYGYTQVLQNAVDYAQSQGVVLVASAGNDGANQVPYPAQFPSVVGVAAVDADSQRASFSNYSDAVDIGAPGVGVHAAWVDDQWDEFSGTSAAAPYVSGAIAATLSLDSSTTPQEAVDIVLAYSDDAAAPGKDVEIGNGILNLDRVLNRDESYIYDVALADFHLDLENATESVVPLLVTVQNRGTEPLNSVSVTITQNDHFPQKVYLGGLSENETTAHTLYLDPNQLSAESGYTITAETSVSGRVDARESNNVKTGVLQLQPIEP